MKNWTLRGGTRLTDIGETSAQTHPAARRALRQVRAHAREFHGAAGMSATDAWVIGVVAEHRAVQRTLAEAWARVFLGLENRS